MSTEGQWTALTFLLFAARESRRNIRELMTPQVLVEDIRTYALTPTFNKDSPKKEEGASQRRDVGTIPDSPQFYPVGQ